METILNICKAKRSILMVLMLLAAATTAARPRAPKVEIQCVLVAKAQIARTSLAKEGDFGRANQGHQIVTGSNSVLAIRIFDDPDKGPDSESFTKVTLEFIPPSELSQAENISVEVLHSFFVDGASGWVHKGNYWWAKDQFPRVQFRRDNAGLYATLKQNVHATNASKVFPLPPQSFPVDVTCPVRKLTVLQLTPWIGRAGTNWHSFYSQGENDQF